MQVKKENKNKREKEKERERESERESKGEKEKERKNIVEQEQNEKGKKIVSGRKYLADQVDYWYCCSISDHLNANLSRNTS